MTNDRDGILRAGAVQAGGKWFLPRMPSADLFAIGLAFALGLVALAWVTVLPVLGVVWIMERLA